MLSGLGGMVAQGMAIGTGSAIAHQAVGGLANAFSGSGKAEASVPEVQAAPAAGQEAQPNATAGACMRDEQELYKCLKEQNGNAGHCQYYFDALRDCQENQRY